jgi:serine/threonine protein phosphatase PrpC
MEHAPRRSEWRVVGASVRGASHVRAGLPNQDAMRWLPGCGAGTPLIVAIADGHGSPKSFRSDAGARFAVDTATQVIQETLAGHAEVAGRATIERTTECLVRRWNEAVEAHMEQTPLSPAELDALETREGAGARRAVESHPFLAYGATLSAVLLAESAILYLQLGDGDILAVSESGQVTRPVPADARLFAGQTTSLCARSAWRDFRFAVHPLDGPGPRGEGDPVPHDLQPRTSDLGLRTSAPSSVPALILLATDGYANSFRDEVGFFRVGSDLVEMIRAEGLEAVHASLETWLNEASQLGSGDDITLGLVCRLGAFQRVHATPPHDPGALDRPPGERPQASGPLARPPFHPPAEATQLELPLGARGGAPRVGAGTS